MRDAAAHAPLLGCARRVLQRNVNRAVVHHRGSGRRRRKRNLPRLLCRKKRSHVGLLLPLWLLARKNARDEHDHERDRERTDASGHNMLTYNSGSHPIPWLCRIKPFSFSISARSTRSSSLVVCASCRSTPRSFRSTRRSTRSARRIRSGSSCPADRAACPMRARRSATPRSSSSTSGARHLLRHAVDDRHARRRRSGARGIASSATPSSELSTLSRARGATVATRPRLFAERAGRAAGVGQPRRRCGGGAAGVSVAATSATAPIAAMEAPERELYALLFHPEVAHTDHGLEILRNFAYGVCGCTGDWTIASFIEEATERNPPAGRQRAKWSAGCPAASTPRSRRC